MAEDNDLDDESQKENSTSLLPLAGWAEKLLKELARLLVFLLSAFVLFYFFNPQPEENAVNFNAILQQDQLSGEVPVRRPLGVEWSMDEIIVNTLDELEEHFVKAKVVVYYEAENPLLLAALTRRSSELHAEVRKIIGSKKYLALKNVKQQELIAQEIKNRISRIIALPGILDIYLREFIVY